MKFYRKPAEVEAKQWWPPGDPRHDPSMLSDRKGNTVDPPDYLQVGDLYQFSKIKGMGDHIFLLQMPNDGRIVVRPGDWIVEAGGRKWAVEAAMFDSLYESAIPADCPHIALSMADDAGNQQCFGCGKIRMGQPCGICNQHVCECVERNLR